MPLLTPVHSMLSAWLLPEHIADVLPEQARRIEELRRALLDRARGYGFELVMPPLLEHLESLLSGTGRELDLKTFKLVDQLSGRTLGLRADTTPQAARIDAHLLNREGVTRLCYCGPVLHTRSSGLSGTREPLQLGAEIFGHAGLEADLEAAELALDALSSAGLTDLVLDLADARVLRGVLAGVPLDSEALQEVVQALSQKDGSALAELTRAVPEAARAGLRALPKLYGGAEVLAAAREALPQRALIAEALDQLQWLASHLQRGLSGLAHRIRPFRHEWLCLLQRTALCHLRQGQQRCPCPRWTLRRGGRDLRAQPPGRGIQPGSEVAGRGRRPCAGAGGHPGALGRGSGPARCRAAAARSRRDRPVRTARAAPCAGRLRV
jgi:hypothetical protein